MSSPSNAWHKWALLPTDEISNTEPVAPVVGNRMAYSVRSTERENCASYFRDGTLAAGITKTLGTPLLIAAVYDRDYFCQEEVDHVKGQLEQTLQTCPRSLLQRDRELPARTDYPSLLDCITVPVRTLNRRRQSRQRNGMVLWAQPVWTRVEPHQWQAMPSGQRSSMNHCSAAASFGNILN